MIDTLLHKMMLTENKTLTSGEIYYLFQREFPHVRYLDMTRNLMYPLRFLRFLNDFYFDIELINNDVIYADGKSKWCVSDDQVILDGLHVFKLYNKPASNDEILKLLYG